MSTASNRFYVESIEDGSTLHGQLLSATPLTQAWTGTTAIPSWTVAANQPLVYVDLLSGSTKVTPDTGGEWFYNSLKIVFSTTKTSRTIGSVTYWGYVSVNGSQTGEGQYANIFFKTGTSSEENDPTKGQPALGIITNLASSSNVNTDSISFKGQYSISGAPIDFTVSTLVRITGISSSGIFGFIEFIGSNIVTTKNQNITMRGRLFAADGTEISAGVSQTSSSEFSTNWTKDNSTIGSGGDVTVGGVTYSNAKQINESDITDNTVVGCTFSYTTSVSGTPTTLTYTTYENIDDQTDNEQMYIQYNGGNDNSATLKKNGSVTFKMWMGTQTSSAVDTSWVNWYCKLLDAEGNVVTGSISGLPAEVASGDYAGWREMSTTYEGQTFKYASINITYDIVHDSSTFKNYLTGIVLAVKNQS